MKNSSSTLLPISHLQECLKGTRLWGGFELEDSKFEPTLEMMLLLPPVVEKEFHVNEKCKNDCKRQRSLHTVWMKKDFHHLQVSCSGEYCKDPDCKNAFS